MNSEELLEELKSEGRVAFRSDGARVLVPGMFKHQVKFMDDVMCGYSRKLANLTVGWWRGSPVEDEGWDERLCRLPEFQTLSGYWKSVWVGDWVLKYSGEECLSCLLFRGKEGEWAWCEVDCEEKKYYRGEVKLCEVLANDEETAVSVGQCADDLDRVVYYFPAGCFFDAARAFHGGEAERGDGVLLCPSSLWGHVCDDWDEMHGCADIEGMKNVWRYKDFDLLREYLMRFMDEFSMNKAHRIEGMVELLIREGIREDVDAALVDEIVKGREEERLGRELEKGEEEMEKGTAGNLEGMGRELPEAGQGKMCRAVVRRGKAMGLVYALYRLHAKGYFDVEGGGIAQFIEQSFGVKNAAQTHSEGWEAKCRKHEERIILEAEEVNAKSGGGE